MVSLPECITMQHQTRQGLVTCAYGVPPRGRERGLEVALATYDFGLAGIARGMGIALSDLMDAA